MPSFKQIVIAIVIGVLMIGCTTKQDEDHGTLRIHFPKVKLILDPQKMEDAYSMAVISQIHRGLFRYNTAGEVLNDLAASWIESSDHRSYKIKLKSSTFSDGTPITPVSVQMTFARMFWIGASMAGDIDYISGSQEFRKTGDLSALGIKPVGTDTIEFILSRPSAIFLKQLAVADCSILKLASFREDPDLTEKGGFSGPYKIVSKQNDGNVTVEKWRSDKLDSAAPPIRVHYFTTDQNPVTLALAGKTDALDHDRVEGSDRRALQEKGWEPTSTELFGEVFVVMNPNTIPEEARKRMFESINASDLATELRRRSYRPAFGVIPFGLPGELSADEVKELHPAHVGGMKKPLTVQLDYEQESELEADIAKFLSSKWAALNIKVDLHPLSKAEKLKRLFGKKSQVIIGKKGMDYPDGYSVLGYFKGNYDSNYFYVNDPVIDQGLAEALQVFDAAARESKYRQLQLKILKKWTVIPLLFGSEASGLWSSKVKALPEHPLGYHMLPLETVEMRR